ncbi:hypothetical protein VNO77_44259 [Canavalia gladiata]|uniref:Uncharacterized protein n=1 Tax=Canavalia gladiata TaxID=3824 RepID=A0AAN9JXX0_CANGL
MDISLRRSRLVFDAPCSSTLGAARPSAFDLSSHTLASITWVAGGLAVIGYWVSLRVPMGSWANDATQVFGARPIHLTSLHCFGSDPMTRVLSFPHDKGCWRFGVPLPRSFTLWRSSDDLGAIPQPSLRGQPSHTYQFRAGL